VPSGGDQVVDVAHQTAAMVPEHSP
jgi:hypothetical protein